MEHALICPQCKAPLKAYWYSRSVVCSFCGTTIKLEESTVSVEDFHKTWQAWNSPESHGFIDYVSIGHRHWALEGLMDNGETMDVYSGRLARWPTERVVIKVLRDDKDAGRLNNEWNTLTQLLQSRARGADHFARLLPQPVMNGVVTGPQLHGRHVSLYRHERGVRYHLGQVAKVYAGGIPPRASIWVWRRLLETLYFAHVSGFVHGAVLPEHILIQEGEHGVRLCGWGLSGLKDSPLPAHLPLHDAFYGQEVKTGMPCLTQIDIRMSARCMVQALGGDVATAALPDSVPSRLAETLTKYATLPLKRSSEVSAWTIRQELEDIAAAIYGAPAFLPLKMPQQVN